MKYVLAIILALLLLVACQPQTPQLPAPQSYYLQSPSYQQSPPSGMAYWDYDSSAAKHIMKHNKQELGPVDFEVFAYGAQQARSVSPNTPLEYRVYVHKKAAGSPPLEPNPELTIFFTVVNGDGNTENYGTPNVPKVHPNNFLRFDKTLGAWINSRGFAQNKLGTQRIVGVVSHVGHNHMIQETIKVR